MARGWRVAAAQLKGCGADPLANRAAAADAVREAARSGAELVLLPELATTCYFCKEDPEPYRSLAEPMDGPLVAMFAELSREHGIAVLLPFYERDAASRCFYNSVVVLGRDGRRLTAQSRRGTIAGARKLHLAATGDPGAADEFRHFTPGGDLGVFDLGGLRLGILICYDRRFPECWRELRALGAELVAIPVAGEGGDGADFFLAELRTHARENGLAVVAANKIGRETVGAGTVDNYGESCIVSAEGDILAHRPGAAGPGLVIAEIDTAAIAATRRRLRFFDQRRLDLFPGPTAVATHQGG